MTLRAVDAISPPTTVVGYQGLISALGIGAVLLYESGWGAPKVSGYAQNSVESAKAALGAGLKVGWILDPDHLALADLAKGGVTEMRVGVEMSIESLQAAGLDPSGGCLHFDLEESDWTAPGGPALCAELSAIFVEACKGTPVVPSQYGNPDILTGLDQALPASQLAQHVWVAYYPGTSVWPSSPARVPGFNDALWDGPGQRGWQWHGGQMTSGYDVDFDVVDFPLFSKAQPPPSPPPPAQVTLAPGSYIVPTGSVISLGTRNTITVPESAS